MVTNTNVLLLVSNPSIKSATGSTSTRTSQVALTVLNALGLNPGALQAVREEGTIALPEVTQQLNK